jgi:chitin disaccharide deacetylase
MKYLIINADDFGFSPFINEGICEAFLHGVLTDASLLVYSPHAEHAVRLAAAAGLSIGVHIDLVTPFVESHSPEFGPHGSLLVELFRREYDKEDGKPIDPYALIHIRDEVRTQVREFCRLVGRLPSHLDYHYGLHYLPEVMAFYLTVAEEFNIPVRWGRQYVGDNPYTLAPTYLCDQFRGNGADGVGLFLDLIRKPWDGILEMICHPGYFTPSGLLDNYNLERENELKVLTDPRIKAGIEEEGIQLVNFDWLKAIHAPLAPHC